MNLQSCNNKMAGAEKNASAKPFFFRQNHRHGLMSPRPMMSLFFRFKCVAVCLYLALTAFSAFSQSPNYYTTNGTEYAIVGSLAGDQVFSDAAISTNGGFVLWQDNITDGNGWGISASHIDSTLSGTLASFRVNVQGANNQENPRVAILKNGGAAFVWEGGAQSQQHIFGRFLTSTNTFLSTNDIAISSYTNNFQINPALAVLNDSNVIVVWSSYDQVKTNSMQDVYGQILSPLGITIGTNFLVNQFTNYNQRTPAVAALTNGGFVVTWVSEQERTNAAITTTNLSGIASFATPSVDIYARLYKSNGVAQAGEFLVNTNINSCAHPSIASAADGSFMVAWDERDLSASGSGLDVFARIFSISGTGGIAKRINTYLSGAQYSPRVSVIAGDYMVVWTSLDQDGSREGVYAQSVHNDGSFVGGELRVNTTTISQQIQPVVASDGAQQFLVIWSSFVGSPYNFDLYAQRYINSAAVLQPMAAPFVWVPFVLSNNVYQPQIVLSWAPLTGLSVSNYEVYVDGAAVPVTSLATNQWTMTAAYGLTASSSHSFQLDYVLTNGQRSPASPAATATTWSGSSWGGVPSEWMAQYYGNANNWPSVNTASLKTLFLTGGTALTQSLAQTRQGLFLQWNTQPGATYQVMVTTDFVTWTNVGSPRFAAGLTDSIYVGGSAAGYYKVALLR